MIELEDKLYQVWSRWLKMILQYYISIAFSAIHVLNVYQTAENFLKLPEANDQFIMLWLKILLILF